MEKMRATVFHGVNDLRVEEVERPRAGVGEAVIRVTLTTICGTDLHIVRRQAAEETSGEDYDNRQQNREALYL